MTLAQDNGDMTQKPARKTLVLVLGMHRSGTSLLSQALARGGLPVSDRVHREAAPDNQAGYWEHVEIVEVQNQLIDRMLDARANGIWTPAAIGLDAAGHRDSPAWVEAKERLKSIVSECFGRANVFGFKDPRSSSLLPLWREISEELDCELVAATALRRPAEVVKSLKARQAIDGATAELLWLRSIADTLACPFAHHWVFVYDDWFDHPDRQAAAVAAFLEICGIEAVANETPARADLRHQRDGRSVLPLLDLAERGLAAAGTGRLDVDVAAHVLDEIQTFVAGIGGWARAHEFLLPAFRAAEISGGELALPWPNEFDALFGATAHLRSPNPWCLVSDGLFQLHANRGGQPAAGIEWLNLPVRRGQRLVGRIESWSSEATPMIAFIRFKSPQGRILANYAYPLNPKTGVDINLPVDFDGTNALDVLIEIMTSGAQDNHHAGAKMRRFRLVTP